MHFAICKVRKENLSPVSQEWKELLKQNKKGFFLVSKVLYFRYTKQPCKNVADTTLKQQ